jgi:hypothetical protein
LGEGAAVRYRYDMVLHPALLLVLSTCNFSSLYLANHLLPRLERGLS